MRLRVGNDKLTGLFEGEQEVEYSIAGRDGESGVRKYLGTEKQVPIVGDDNAIQGSRWREDLAMIPALVLRSGCHQEEPT